MKISTKPILLLLFVLVSAASQARIWRLNNNGAHPQPIIDADFRETLQKAHDSTAVVDGDTIHVEQSPVSYGSLVMTKRLVIIGSGYFLDKNPQTQVNTAWGSKVDNVSFVAATTEGSFITGLQIGNISINYSNITVNRNYITGYVGIGTTGSWDTHDIRLLGNFIHNTTFNANISVPYQVSTMIYSNGAQTGPTGKNERIVIQGNIIMNHFTYSVLGNGWQQPGGIGMELGSNCGGIIKNNYFASNSRNMSVHNFYILNNLANDKGTNGFTNCRFEFNLGLSDGQFVSPGTVNAYKGPGNQTVSSLGFAGGSSTDGQYQLATGALALTAGKTNLPCGPFGGDYPYKLSGLAAIPNIYTLTLSPIDAGATSMDVSLDTKSNN